MTGAVTRAPVDMPAAGRERLHMPIICPLSIQLPIIPEDALLVECNPPLRGEISSDARALSDAVV
jgi:hypothetical protein